ncbi:MAG TPA: serine/threonine-protein kinase [Polyangia bacterium]|nr:serine/threonine-protein kinase [Polyangia bacterium]
MEPPDSSAPDPRIGRVLQGRYRIISKLAAGAMGVVYKGERLQLARPVAVKFLHPWIAAQKAFLGRFENEARAMSRLNHPHCVSVIDFGVEGQPYLVMDFVTGTTVRDVLQAGPPSVARTVRIVRQLLAGLTHAHAQGIIHRDLKPDNLILGDEAGLVDHLRILDFGLAKLRDGPAMTVGLAIGTPSYMSPEQTGAEGAIDARSDLYSVGVLLFELLAGRKPFLSDHVGDLLLMHRESPAPAINTVRPEAHASEALEQVVRRALAKAPGDRFQSAAEFSQALEQTPEGRQLTGGAADPSAADQTTPDAPAAPPPSSASRARARRRGRLVGATLAVAAVAALAIGVVLRRGDSPPTPAAPTPPHRVVEQRSLSLAPPPSRPAPAPAVAASSPPPSTGAAAPTGDYAAALGNLQQRRFAEGMADAEKAARANPALKTDPALIKAVVQALGAEKTAERAQAFLRRAGSAATPVIKEAAHRDPNPKVRARAAELLDEGRGRSFFGSPSRSSSSSFFKR